jgi:hypothetical protein
MKQDVQIMVHLYFEQQNSEAVNGVLEPTRDMIRQELYKILKDEKPLSYTEIRGESHE